MKDKIPVFMLLASFLSSCDHSLEVSFIVNGLYLEMDSPRDNLFKLCTLGSIGGMNGRDYSYKGEVPNTLFY